MAFIEVTNLVKEYPNAKGKIAALNAVSLAIEKGAFVTITGASGSGKTTLLLILGGLLHPTSGKMTFQGTEIDLQSDRTLTHFRSENIGYVMQHFALIPYLTATENVAIAFKKKMSKKESTQKAIELLESVGLGDRVTHYPRELSAGQQQRVAIARALSNNPAIILADEPTGNLDPALATEILDLLQHINQQHQTTIVMVTHSKEAANYGTVKIQLQEGKLLN